MDRYLKIESTRNIVLVFPRNFFSKMLYIYMYKCKDISTINITIDAVMIELRYFYGLVKTHCILWRPWIVLPYICNSKPRHCHLSAYFVSIIERSCDTRNIYFSLSWKRYKGWTKFYYCTLYLKHWSATRIAII